MLNGQSTAASNQPVENDGFNAGTLPSVILNQLNSQRLSSSEHCDIEFSTFYESDNGFATAVFYGHSCVLVDLLGKPFQLKLKQTMDSSNPFGVNKGGMQRKFHITAPPGTEHLVDFCYQGRFGEMTDDNIRDAANSIKVMVEGGRLQTAMLRSLPECGISVPDKSPEQSSSSTTIVEVNQTSLVEITKDVKALSENREVSSNLNQIDDNISVLTEPLDALTEPQYTTGKKYTSDNYVVWDVDTIPSGHENVAENISWDLSPFNDKEASLEITTKGNEGNAVVIEQDPASVSSNETDANSEQLGRGKRRKRTRVGVSDDFDYSPIQKSLRNSSRITRLQLEPSKEPIGSCCGEHFYSKFKFGSHLFHNHSIPMVDCASCTDNVPLGGLQNHFEKLHGLIPAREHPSQDVSSLGSNLEAGTNHVLANSIEVVCRGCRVSMPQQEYISHLKAQLNAAQTELLSLSTEMHRVHRCVLFQCTICQDAGINVNKPIRLYLLVKTHIERYHSTNCSKDDKETCPICGRMVLCINFEKHQEQHLFQDKNSSSKTKLPCDICGKVVTKKRISVHRRTHFDRFQCPHCSKVFNRKENLRVHEMIHTGEKPYVCDICGKGFRQYVELRLHNRKHEKDGTLLAKQSIGGGFAQAAESAEDFADNMMQKYDNAFSNLPNVSSISTTVNQSNFDMSYFA